MTAGATGAWADDNYYSQDYNSQTVATNTWASAFLAGSLSLQNGSGDDKYIQFADNSSNTGPRTAYSQFNVTYGGDAYILEFDAAITTQSSNNIAHWTELVVASNNYSLAGNQYFVDKNTASKNYLFMLRSDQGADNTVTSYYINGGSTPITIASGSLFHVKLTVSVTNKKVKYVLTGAVSTSGTYTITDDSGLYAQALVATLGRQASSSIKVDNVFIRKLGWDVTLYSTYLTNGNEDNKIASGYPAFYNPDNVTSVSYNYDGTVLGNYDKAYPPRMKSTGDGTVTVTIGTGSDAITSSYTYRVNSAAGGGTYDAATKTYTFDKVGTVANKSVSDVPGITMSFNGGPTALVVDRSGTKYLKVIDANGYSHPNLNEGGSTIPPENNWGGTFYKFVPSVDGKLSVTGNFDYMKLYESDGATLTTSANSGTSFSDVDLKSGKTYYLYNAGSDNKGSTTPLLHSFSYTPNASSLTFRNPQPVITVDISEGSYTNPAISAQGLPISYEITSGSSYASIDQTTGKVTFTANLTEPSYSITVKATDGSEAISYTLNLVRRTWIFDDNSKWTTTSSQLGTNWDTGQTYTGNGLNGTTFCREKNAYNYTELISSGTTPLPETRGLLISKAANNDRLYIAPKDYSTNFLATRATFIAIDDVQEGQTVTVDWYGGNSSAVLDLSDAAGENVRGTKRGPTTLTVTQDGRVSIASNAVVSYIRSIKVSTPTRAIGTLNYAKTVLSGSNTQVLTGFTITDEAGTADLSSAYYAPQYFTSSNPSVVSVDASTGLIQALSTGVAVITATATAKSSATHQETVTLIATIEVVNDANTRIRTIDIDDLLYTTNVSASNGLNRRIPGFDIAFEGGDGAKCNYASSVILRNGTGKMTITPRVREGETVTITKALVTVKSATDTPTWIINGGSAESVSEGGITLGSLSGTKLTIESGSGSIEITDIKIYYRCSNSDNADYCLDETKVAPTFGFNTQHFMRVPADGREVTQTPTLVEGDWFKSFNVSYTYTSNNAAIATINSDGTNGQLVASGQATITATFYETAYFAAATASYSVSNTLLPGESYGVISIAAGQKIHIQASASAANTNLTLSGTATSTLTYGTTEERRNTYANTAGTVTLSNGTDKNITIYSVHVVTSILRQWLYYAGQEENYLEQVQFNGFSTGAIAGFRIIDIGDPENPIDLTDAYALSSSGTFSVGNASVLSGLDSSTGSATATIGSTTISHDIVKTGQADGYNDTYSITSTVTVLNFGATNDVVWSFINNIANVDKTLGDGWAWDDRGFHYGYFADYKPITAYDGSVYAPSNAQQMHGVMLKDEFRWYAAEVTRGLRANLSSPNSSIKFPVKAGMEIDIEVATSSADIVHTISNVTDLTGATTTNLEIDNAGWANNIHAYYLAKADGCVEIRSNDKVGMYLKSITLRVPKIHFKDDIVTVLNTASSTVTNATINVPSTSLQYLSYEILSGYSFDADGNEELLADVNTFATIGSNGVVTLTGTEGWITVKVTNTNPNPTNLEPREGTYTLYAVDFRFDPATESLNLDDDPNKNKEMDFSRRPIGINKVATPINYSFEIPSGSNAKAILRQSTNPDPALTTYLLTAYNKGEIIVKAKTGRIEATCTLTVSGHTFEKVVDVLSESDIADNDYTYTINLPDYYNADNSSQWSLAWAYEGVFSKIPTVTLDLTIPDGLTGDARAAYPGKLNIKDLYGTDATHRSHGAIRFIASHSSGNSTQFVLTLSYPASSGKKWDFYRSTTGLKAQTDHDNKIGDYVGTHLNPQTVSSYTITGTGNTDAETHWTTDASWTKIYRNGDKEPRWAYGGSVKCDNAFIIEETAGLQIETPKESFYVDNNTTAAYCHVGLHSRSTITIPKLKQGDFVRLNLSRVIPNNGAIIEAKNVTDLADKPVTEVFTISRSQIDYKENDILAVDENGSRIIPGYYTFKVAADGDVSFTLADEGYLDVLSVEIYDQSVTDTYLGTKAADGYQHTLTRVKSTDEGNPYAKTVLLKENDDTETLRLAFCHPMWSTSTGPADYVLRSGPTANLDADLASDPWMSGGGVWYENGIITARQGYGKITVRMNNYTADRKYLIGYSPDYTVTVGHHPHQDYPYTWNFTNISGGEVKGEGNNVYNSVNGDTDTWTSRGSNVFELDTDTEGGSFYVPGATLVSTPRDLGEKGTRTALDAAGLGCDEFNGLGFNGQIMFKTESQSSSARTNAPRRAATPGAMTIDLLSYKMSDPNYIYRENLKAGNGTIMFYQQKRIESDADCGYAFDMDGYNTKYALLTPMRPFRVGDKIIIRAYPKDASGSGFSFYSGRYSDSHNGQLLQNTSTMSSVSEQYIEYTVTSNDNIEGRSNVYLYYNGIGHSYLTEIYITGSYSAPASKMLYAVAPTTITIPDLNADGKQDWIYIKASQAPTAITNATLVTDAATGGADAAETDDNGISTYKYKVTAAGSSDVTFNGDTEIDQIGVTHILKEITKVGDDAWATESRDHSIDHTLTGYFTVNNVDAYTATATYDSKSKTTVTLHPTNPITGGVEAGGYVPEETGLVLRLKNVVDADLAKTNSWDGTTEKGKVPLFYPAITTGQTATTVDFPASNLMYPNLTENELVSETETVGGTDYTRFILAKRYMTWRKQDGTVTYDDAFDDSKEVAAFYRMHLYGSDFDGESATALNTLGANKAYLLLETSEINPAIWTSGSPSRRYVPILGVSDMDEDFGDESADGFCPSDKTYNLRGQAIDTDGAPAPGIYIRNGKKIIIKR